MALPCARCPVTEGNRSNLLRPSAGSAGLLAGEVRREVLHRRSHQPRPLFKFQTCLLPRSSRLWLIAPYLTLFPWVCQFLFLYSRENETTSAILQFQMLGVGPEARFLHHRPHLLPCLFVDAGRIAAYAGYGFIRQILIAPGLHISKHIHKAVPKIG